MIIVAILENGSLQFILIGVGCSVVFCFEVAGERLCLIEFVGAQYLLSYFMFSAIL